MFEGYFEFQLNILCRMRHILLPFLTICCICLVETIYFYALFGEYVCLYADMTADNFRKLPG